MNQCKSRRGTYEQDTLKSTARGSQNKQNCLRHVPLISVNVNYTTDGIFHNPVQRPDDLFLSHQPMNTHVPSKNSNLSSGTRTSPIRPCPWRNELKLRLLDRYPIEKNKPRPRWCEEAFPKCSQRMCASWLRKRRFILRYNQFIKSYSMFKRQCHNNQSHPHYERELSKCHLQWRQIFPAGWIKANKGWMD
jgi:hypothetical protein